MLDKVVGNFGGNPTDPGLWLYVVFNVFFRFARFAAFGAS